jgi:hypothetical protein
MGLRSAQMAHTVAAAQARLERAARFGFAPDSLSIRAISMSEYSAEREIVRATT